MGFLAGFVLVLLGCGAAVADDAQDRENAVAIAVAPMATELKRASDDTRALAKATVDFATARRAFVAYLDAHPAERTPAFARIVTAADKLIANVDQLRALVDAHGDGGEIHMIAIDALHRLNEFIDAHQRVPPHPERAYPDELVERFVAMLERVAREAQANRADCAKLGAALAAHLGEDAAIDKEMREIDDARPQDQREAERRKPRPKFAARYQQAIAQRAPVNACKADPRVAAYLDTVELQR